MTHQEWLERHQAIVTPALATINLCLGQDRVGDAKDSLERLGRDLDQIWEQRRLSAQQEMAG